MINNTPLHHIKELAEYIALQYEEKITPAPNETNKETDLPKAIAKEIDISKVNEINKEEFLNNLVVEGYENNKALQQAFRSYVETGISINKKMAGNVADFTTFSFHAVKNLTTGEGGAVTWKSISGLDNDYLYKQFQLLSLHGQTKDALHKEGLGNWEYDIVAPLYKCNMTDIMASIGLAQLKRYSQLIAKRHKIIKKYNEAFKDLPVQVLNHLDNNHQSSGHLYLVRINNINETTRNEIIMEMAKRGITTNVHYKPLPILTAYKNLGFDIKDYLNSYFVCYDPYDLCYGVYYELDLALNSVPY